MLMRTPLGEFFSAVVPKKELKPQRFGNSFDLN
jgi:hypothetical protein